MTKKTANQPSAAAATAQIVSFEDARQAVTEKQMVDQAAKTATQFDQRMKAEHAAHPHNESKQVKLAAAKKKMTSLGIAGVMVAAHVDAAFINRQINEGAFYNVYAFDKLNDLMGGLCSGSFKNAVNVAIMKSLFKFRAAGVAFTGLAATAACSDKIKVEKGMTALLVRHSVSAATAPTQTSSTMNALQTLGVVKNKGSNKFPLWELTDEPVTHRLEELLKVA